jgi:hypothetical protein
VEKLNRIRVLAPLNVAAYVAALWLAGYMPGRGNAALFVMDFVTIGVAILIARRFKQAYSSSTWAELGPKLGVFILVMLAIATCHAVGMFIGDDDAQRVLAFGPVSVAVVIYVFYLLDKHKPERDA